MRLIITIATLGLKPCHHFLAAPSKGRYYNAEIRGDWTIRQAARFRCFRERYNDSHILVRNSDAVTAENATMNV